MRIANCRSICHFHRTFHQMARHYHAACSVWYCNFALRLWHQFHRPSRLVLYLHASLFMVAAAYTLQVDGHVRVDIFLFALHTEKQSLDRYSRARNFFLLPSMLAILYFSWPSVRNAWAIKEGAISVGGLPASFLLKTLIPIFCILLILQSISCLLRNINTYFEKA